METILIIWSVLTMLSILVYGFAFLVHSEKTDKPAKTEILFRGCCTLLIIGIIGMLIISAIAFII